MLKHSNLRITHIVTKMHKKNQITPPRVNQKGKMTQEPKKVKLYFKSGNATMLFIDKIDYIVAMQLESRLRRFLREKCCKLEGTFIYTQ